MRKIKNVITYSLITATLIAGMLYINRATAPKELTEFNKQEADQNKSKFTSTAKVELKATSQIEPIVEKPQTTTIKYSDESFISITRKDLMVDITANYPNVPTRAKKEIVDTIIEVAKQYNINPLILYAMCHVESSMNPYEIHREMVITIGDKKLKINAKGLAGIVFEWHGEKLINAGIIANRADLLDPILNIRALGFIYSDYYKMPLHTSARSKDESAMLRYFGGDFPSYSKRIDDKIGTLISDKLYR